MLWPAKPTSGPCLRRSRAVHRLALPRPRSPWPDPVPRPCLVSAPSRPLRAHAGRGPTALDRARGCRALDEGRLPGPRLAVAARPRRAAAPPSRLAAGLRARAARGRSRAGQSRCQGTLGPRLEAATAGAGAGSRVRHGAEAGAAPASRQAVARPRRHMSGAALRARRSRGRGTPRCHGRPPWPRAAWLACWGPRPPWPPGLVDGRLAEPPEAAPARSCAARGRALAAGWFGWPVRVSNPSRHPSWLC